MERMTSSAVYYRASRLAEGSASLLSARYCSSVHLGQLARQKGRKQYFHFGNIYDDFAPREMRRIESPVIGFAIHDDLLRDCKFARQMVAQAGTEGEIGYGP